MKQLLDYIATASGITCDSRLVRPGYIFFAIKGRETDGNDYAYDAQRRGAIAVVTDQQPPNLTIPVFVIGNARKMLAAAAAQFYRHPSKDLDVIGVTGTNGKTTITYMLEHIFNHSGFKTGLIGTVKVNTGYESFPSRLTTPDAVSLQNYLAQMRANGVTHVPIEVSAQGVEMHRVDNLSFSCGILSNISPDHLDFHGTFENYVASKQKFTELLDKKTPLIINITDPGCQAIASRFQGFLVTAAVNAAADIRVQVLNTTVTGCRFEITHNELNTVYGQKTEPSNAIIQLPLPGFHNVENALLAAAAAILHDIPLPTIASALHTFAGVERRMNVFQVLSRTIIDDTALNPASINAVLNSLPAFNCRHIFVVNAIRGSRGTAINEANAKAIADLQQQFGFSLAITASVGDVQSSDIVTPAEKAVFLTTLDKQHAHYTYFSTLTAAIDSVLNKSRSNDLIALLGAQGMDNGRKALIALSSLFPDQAELQSAEALQQLAGAI